MSKNIINERVDKEPEFNIVECFATTTLPKAHEYIENIQDMQELDQKGMFIGVVDAIGSVALSAEFDADMLKQNRRLIGDTILKLRNWLDFLENNTKHRNAISIRDYGFYIDFSDKQQKQFEALRLKLNSYSHPDKNRSSADEQYVNNAWSIRDDFLIVVPKIIDFLRHIKEECDFYGDLSEYHKGVLEKVTKDAEEVYRNAWN
ncbi:MAG: hypothetical protein LBM09_01300 [Candidatus Nomurabacteria bacterium]|jgi:hypothetical protein|nr:hypothetical protein [Candidatus Nomurabacteria bacterium]